MSRICFFRICKVIVFLPLLYLVLRGFVCDRFIINGHSMEPTRQDGEVIWANKLIMGGRIYTNYNFDVPYLHCLRMPGIRRLNVGDCAVYNYPYGWEMGKIGFKINYVLAKRCVACPGDTIRIVGGYYDNSRTGSVGIPREKEEELASIPDTVLIKCHSLKAGQFANEQERWTIKNYGPITVPAKGMTIFLDSLGIQYYSRYIEYETGISIKNIDCNFYTFQQDYYFFAGDNVVNSRDSRYDGFVPESFIIGIY